MNKILIKDLGVIQINPSDTRKRQAVLVACPTCNDQRVMTQNNYNTAKSTKCTKCRNILHNKSTSKYYSIWKMIKQRCYNEKCINYKYYGARGITMCDEWKNSFTTFESWILDTYPDTENLSIDRIDNNKGYSPDNCRMTTHVNQMNNQRPRQNQSGYSCISLCKKSSNWVVRYDYNLKHTHVGSFKTLEEAVKALHQSLNDNNINKSNIKDITHVY